MAALRRHFSASSDSDADAPFARPGYGHGAALTRLGSEHDVEKMKHSDLTQVLSSSSLSTIFSLANVILGSGVVGVPLALHQCGLVTGMIVLLVLAAATCYSLHLLIASANLFHPRPRRLDAMLAVTTGPTGKICGLLTILMLDFGVKVALMIIIGDVLTPLLSIPRSLTLVLVSLVVAPLALMPRLEKLSLTSFLSVVSVMLLIVIIIVRSFTIVTSDFHSVKYYSHNNPMTLLIGHSVMTGLGSLSFVFVCMDVSFELYESLPHRSVRLWDSLATISVVVSLVPIVLIAFVGWLTFGHALDSNILNNFDDDDWLINVARLFLGMSMILTIPVNTVMCRQSLIEMLPKRLRENDRQSQPLSVMVTVGLIVASLLVSLVCDELGTVQSLVGSLCSATLAFILPAVIAIQTRLLTGQCQSIVDMRMIGPVVLLVSGCAILLNAVIQIAIVDD